MQEQPASPTNETYEKSSTSFQSKQSSKFSPLKSAIEQQSNTQQDYSQLQQRYYPSASRYFLEHDNTQSTTVGDWVIFIILLMIPIVNLIAMIIFACDKNKPSRANFAKVLLIIMGFFILWLLYSSISH